MKRILVLIFCFVLLSSHELFLKSDAYFLDANEESELFLFNGTFDHSENIISRDRIQNAKIIGPNYEFLPTEKDYYDKDEVTYLRFRTGNSGTYVAGVSTLPREIDLSAEEFNEYLAHEELTDIIAERKVKGITNTPAREKYSKHVKALLQVNEKKTNHYITELSYPIEFVPRTNPYLLNKGDQLSIILLKEGKPLANQIVHFGTRSSSENNSNYERSTRTDENGLFTIILNQVGKWYIATIHMIESDEQNIDYVSNWATLTFEIK